MKLSVVIPAYNEADGISGTIDEIETYMHHFSAADDWELIVVNDGSSDGTMAILRQAENSRSHLKVVDLVNNYGRGRALRAGINAATGDIIVSLDADLSYAPYHIERLVEKMTSQNADIVVASAYGKNGTVTNVPFIRLWISRIGNRILSYMYGGEITVLTCMVRAYKKAFVKKLDLFSDGKDIHLEILYKSHILGGKIVEIPGDLAWREEKKAAKKNAKRRSTLKFRKTGKSHFFFALMNRPGVIFRIPAVILLTLSMFILVVTMKNVAIDIFNGMTVYHAFRNSLLSAMLSWLTFSVAFILSIQFFTLGFLTNQNKKNYEETYKTVNAILTELKKRE